MGKFDGILLCTDLDGTLLNSDCLISPANADAIKYFMSEGGMFAFATGRNLDEIERYKKVVSPNMPIVLLNGTAIYDDKKSEYVWEAHIDSDVKRIIELFKSEIDDFGYAVYTNDVIYFGELDKWYERYYKITQFEGIEKFTDDIDTAKWKKVVFYTNEDNAQKMGELIKCSEFADKYTYMKSWSTFFEVLPKGATKGNAIKRIVESSSCEIKSVIAAGDAENDIDAILYATVGVATKNAMESVKRAADYVTVSNDDDAIKDIINKLESGELL